MLRRQISKEACGGQSSRLTECFVIRLNSGVFQLTNKEEGGGGTYTLYDILLSSQEGVVHSEMELSDVTVSSSNLPDMK